MALSKTLLESISELTERLSSMEANFDKLSSNLGAVQANVDLVMTSISLVQQEQVQVAELLKSGAAGSTTSCVGDQIGVLKFTKSGCVVQDQQTDNIDDGPVCDTESVPDHVAVTVLDQEPDDLSAARAGVILGGGPLFDEDSKYAEAKLITGQHFVIGADFAPPATTGDTPFTCSLKCLQLVANTETMLVTTPLQEFKGINDDKVMATTCRMFNHYCSSFGDHGELFLDDTVATVGFEHHFWDPGAPADSQFIEFVHFDPEHNHELYVDECESKLWDPGLAGSSWFLAHFCVKGKLQTGDWVLLQKDVNHHVLACGVYCAQLLNIAVGSTCNNDMGAVPAMLFLGNCFCLHLVSGQGTQRVVLHGILIFMQWIFGVELLYSSQEVPGQGSVLMSEVAGLGEQLLESLLSIRQLIQGHQVPVLVETGSSYSVVAIQVADKLCCRSLLSKFLLVHMDIGAQIVSKSQLLGATWTISVLVLQDILSTYYEAYTLQNTPGNSKLLYLLFIAKNDITMPNFVLKDGWVSYKSRIWVRAHIALQSSFNSAHHSSILEGRSAILVVYRSIDQHFVSKGVNSAAYDLVIPVDPCQIRILVSLKMMLEKQGKLNMAGYELLLRCDEETDYGDQILTELYSCQGNVGVGIRVLIVTNNVLPLDRDWLYNSQVMLIWCCLFISESARLAPDKLCGSLVFDVAIVSTSHLLSNAVDRNSYKLSSDHTMLFF